MVVFLAKDNFVLSFNDSFFGSITVIKKITVAFDHYYFSGIAMFKMLNEFLDNKKEKKKILKSNPLYGILGLPRYLWFLKTNLKMSNYVRGNSIKQTFNRKSYTMNKVSYIPSLLTNFEPVQPEKRYFAYLKILEEIYKTLPEEKKQHLEKYKIPLKVAFTIGFDETELVNNNVGLIIIDYFKGDSDQDIKSKLKKNAYQAFSSNFLTLIPLVPYLKFEIRKYVDIILTSIYLHNNATFKVRWTTGGRIPVEEVYTGALSQIKDDGTLAVHTSIITSE